MNIVSPPGPVTISGQVREDDGTGNPTPPPVAGALVELVGLGVSTTTDVNGQFTLNTTSGQTAFLRVTNPGYYGVQLLLVTDNISGYDLPLFPDPTMQTFYNGASGGTVIVDVNDGSIFVEDADQGVPGPTLTVTFPLSFDANGNFGGDEEFFMNVLTGTATISISSPGGPCSIRAGLTLLPSPVPLRIDPKVVTVYNEVCP